MSIKYKIVFLGLILIFGIQIQEFVFAANINRSFKETVILLVPGTGTTPTNYSENPFHERNKNFRQDEIIKYLVEELHIDPNRIYTYGFNSAKAENKVAEFGAPGYKNPAGKDEKSTAITGINQAKDSNTGLNLSFGTSQVNTAMNGVANNVVEQINSQTDKYGKNWNTIQDVPMNLLPKDIICITYGDGAEVVRGYMHSDTLIKGGFFKNLSGTDFISDESYKKAIGDLTQAQKDTFAALQKTLDQEGEKAKAAWDQMSKLDPMALATNELVKKQVELGQLETELTKAAEDRKAEIQKEIDQLNGEIPLLEKQALDEQAKFTNAVAEVKALIGIQYPMAKQWNMTIWLFAYNFDTVWKDMKHKYGEYLEQVKDAEKLYTDNKADFEKALKIIQSLDYNQTIQFHIDEAKKYCSEGFSLENISQVIMLNPQLKEENMRKIMLLSLLSQLIDDVPDTGLQLMIRSNDTFKKLGNIDFMKTEIQKKSKNVDNALAMMAQPIFDTQAAAQVSIKVLQFILVNSSVVNQEDQSFQLVDDVLSFRDTNGTRHGGWDNLKDLYKGLTAVYVGEGSLLKAVNDFDKFDFSHLWDEG